MGLDRGLFFVLYSFSHQYDVVAHVISVIAHYFIVAIILLDFFFALRIGHIETVRFVICSFVSILISLLCAYLIQWVIPRERPFVIYGLVPILQHDTDASFPSDYATVAAALSMSLIPRTKASTPRIVASVLTFMLPWSRVCAGLHFPSDVLGGLALGTFVAAVIQRGYVATQPMVIEYLRKMGFLRRYS